MATTREQEAARLLREAAARVEQALQQLNTGEKGACRACGHRVFANAEHQRVYYWVSPSPEKFRRAADKLEGKEQQCRRA